MADAEPAKKPDLAVRTASAIVMLVVAGTALWLGGWVWTIFVLLVGAGVWFEWGTLCLLIYPPGARRTAWRYAGAVYCGIACAMLLTLRDQPLGIFWVLLVAGAVVATDVGAYFFGRTIGGPKIAPKISPSKTWAGLAGGMIGAALAIAAISTAWWSGLCDVMNPPAPLPNRVMFDGPCSLSAPPIPYLLRNSILGGVLIAIVAQSGDFFESWMKRRAGVKDSGKLIPGHGGLFDRVDGLLSVLFVLGIIYLAARLTGVS